jgi:hypothetical protein
MPWLKNIILVTPILSATEPRSQVSIHTKTIKRLALHAACMLRAAGHELPGTLHYSGTLWLLYPNATVSRVVISM